MVLTAGYYVAISAFCTLFMLMKLAPDPLTVFLSGFIAWYSRLYRNQGSLLFGPGPLDWGEQIIVVTGGACSPSMALFAY
jgi:hypothetical protein